MEGRHARDPYPVQRRLSIDHALMAEHGKWLIENGCTAIVAHGSLGEGATLSFEEKVALQKTYVAALPETPIIPGVAALSTKEAVDLAKAAKDNGCRGLMVLPPYLYSSDWREMKAHMTAVISATDLPCIVYNNPSPTKPTSLRPHQGTRRRASKRRRRQGILHRRPPHRRHPRALRRPRGARRGRG
jgi:dihydrodipicolinate synthase/N-acetylneuraminate lyase